MGKNNKRHSKLNFQTSVSQFVKHPYMLLITMLIPIFAAIYQLGGTNMGAQNDKEMAESERRHIIELIEQENKHREELNALDMKLNAMEKERDEWKEKYFILLNSSDQPTNNSP